MYRKTSIWEDIKASFQRGSTVTRLIYVNIGVFLLINIGFVIARLFDNATTANIPDLWLKIFTLPADLHKLAVRPWTLITHMFSHFGFFHILFNMLWLYWMGRIFREYLGNRKVLPVYMLGAWAGALLYILAYNIFPGLHNDLPQVEALGASAGVMAIVVATATLLPDYTIFLLFIGPVKLKWLALAAVILDLISIQGINSGGHIAHLGGALFGFLFIRQLRKGNDWSHGFNRVFDWLVTVFRPDPDTVIPRGKTRKRAHRQKKNRQNGPGNVQEKIDAILDKIAESGYDSLTKEEKEFLFRVSNRNL